MADEAKSGEGKAKALAGALGRARGPIAIALTAAAATAAAFTVYSSSRSAQGSQRAQDIHSASPLADKPLPDLPAPRDFKSFVWAVILRQGHDNMSLIAAGVAFYLLLAIFPAILTFLSIYGLFLDPRSAADQAAAATAILPEEAARLLREVIANLAARSTSDLNATAALSLLVATWSARSGVGALMTGVNIANDTAETRSFAHLQILAIALTVGALVGVAVTMAAITAAPVLLHLAPGSWLADSWLVWSRWPALIALAYAAITLLYRLGPARVLHNWRFFNAGALTATALWFFGSLAFSYYAGTLARFDATYGSIGAVVILLFWLWLSALVVLLGAEIEAELAFFQTTPEEPPK